MRTAKYRPGPRRSAGSNGRRRIIAAVATLVAFGGIVTVTQVSDASTRRATHRAFSSASPDTSGADTEAGEPGASRADRSASLPESSSAPAEPDRSSSDSQSSPAAAANADSTAGASAAGAQVNGLDILT